MKEKKLLLGFLWKGTLYVVLGIYIEISQVLNMSKHWNRQ